MLKVKTFLTLDYPYPYPYPIPVTNFEKKYKLVLTNKHFQKFPCAPLIFHFIMSILVSSAFHAFSADASQSKSGGPLENFVWFVLHERFVRHCNRSVPSQLDDLWTHMTWMKTNMANEYKHGKWIQACKINTNMEN